MSLYYKYNFVSPEPIYALIKEELRTYFEAGAVDDAMFSTWTDSCLKKLGKASNKVLETILLQEDFQSKLPPDFYGVREAWLCHHLEGVIQFPNARYEQIFCKVTPEIDECNPCNDCLPDILRVTYKHTEIGPVPIFKVKRVHLLKPGNIHTVEQCDLPCKNIGASSVDSFDIRDNKFVTNLRKAIVHLVYYSKERDGEGFQLVPDNYWIQEYVKRYIKYKVFEQLWNQTTDETYNQIKQKMDYYKTSYDEAVIMAEVEIKKRDAWQIQMAIKRDTNRLNAYKIGLTNGRSRW